MRQTPLAPKKLYTCKAPLRHAPTPGAPPDTPTKNGRSLATVKEGMGRRQRWMLLRWFVLFVVVSRRDIYFIMIDVRRLKKDAIGR